MSSRTWILTSDDLAELIQAGRDASYHRHEVDFALEQMAMKLEEIGERVPNCPDCGWPVTGLADLHYCGNCGAARG